MQAVQFQPSRVSADCPASVAILILTLSCKTSLQIAGDRLTKIATQHWSESARAAGSAPAFSSDLVKKIYQQELGGGSSRPPALKRIMLLEVGSRSTGSSSNGSLPLLPCSAVALQEVLFLAAVLETRSSNSSSNTKHKALLALQEQGARCTIAAGPPLPLPPPPEATCWPPTPACIVYE
jgi:hypothetical protein